MTKTKIEWTDAVWNPVTGCTKVSSGCKNCYAERIFQRPYPGRAFSDVRCHPERLDAPLRWRAPRRIFVNSMSDLFHEDVPDEFIDKIFAVMTLARRHVFQILTKRTDRMHRYLSTDGNVTRWCAEARKLPEIFKDGKIIDHMAWRSAPHNVWLGVSVEDQATADERIPMLLETPAALRWISAEPLLGRLDISRWLCPWSHSQNRYGKRIDWVIVGGESGPKARPVHPDWARSLRDQCQAAGVPFFFKQWGTFGPEQIGHARHVNMNSGIPMDEPYPMYRVGKKSAGRLLDGREWNEYPQIIHRMHPAHE